jgi:hypothetical protein
MSENKVKINILNYGRLPQGLTGPLYGYTTSYEYYNTLKILGYQVQLVEDATKEEVEKVIEETTAPVEEPLKAEEKVETVDETEIQPEAIKEEEVEVQETPVEDEIVNEETTTVEETPVEEAPIEEEIVNEEDEVETVDETEATPKKKNSSKKKKKN